MVSKTEFDMIYNWRNELRANVQGEQYVAAQAAADYHKRGFSQNEALEMLAADNHDLRIAESAVKMVYEPRTASTKPTRTAMVVPTGYNDVVPVIEDTLSRLSAREFVNRLTKSEQPIVRVSQKQIESLVRLAERAKTTEAGLVELHAELKPWVEETMLKSVLLAEKEKGRIDRIAKSNKQFKVTMRKEAATVDLESGTSTGTRFEKGNFADFGLADEFMVQAADHVSPYERLKRALGN